MKKLCLFFLCSFVFSVLIISCQSENSDDQQSAEVSTSGPTSEIPALLDRHPDLRQEKEWDQVQNQFVQFREQLQAEKKPNEARLNLALLFINEARITGEHGHYYPAALQVLNAALDKKDKDKDLRFRLLSTKAGILLSLHQFREGHKVALQALELNPYNSGIYGILVDANVELGNYEKAVEMADKMVAIRPDLRSYARVSYLREIHGDWKGAIEAMQMAVKAGFPGLEQTAWTRLTLGNLYAEYGDGEQARKQYEVVLANRPDYPFALAAIARLEMKEGNDAEAEKLLTRAAGIIPEFSFYQDLAEIYRKTGRTEAFETTSRELLAMLAEDEASGHRMDLEKAVVYAHLLENYDQALAAVQVAFQDRPDNIDVNRIMADVLIRSGQEDKAAPYLHTASKTNSQKPELLELKHTLAMK